MRYGNSTDFSRSHTDSRKGNGNTSSSSGMFPQSIGIFPIKIDFLLESGYCQVETAAELCMDNQNLKDKGGRKFLLLLPEKGIIIGLYPMEGGCHGYILHPPDHAGAAPFHL